MAMNQWLADMYGTNGASEAQEKTAELELFAKLAADNGIDLSRLTAAQVHSLYAETFGKVAEEGSEEEGDDDSGEEDKKEQAVAEHEEKKESAAKLAEADLMGRVMAHALVSELGQIEKSAAMPAFLQKGMAAVGNAAGKSHSAEQAVSGRVGKALAGKKLPKGVGIGGIGTATSEGKELVHNRNVSLGRKALGSAAGSTALVGGATYAATRKKKSDEQKESSAFETLAAENAIKVAAAAGYDADEALQRVNAVYILGLGESEKVGHIERTDDALHVRALEYLESAGYPVNWQEVFGG
jgi:hypothetical protein